MPLHPEIKKIVDSIPHMETKPPVVPEQHRKMFDTPILSVEQRVQVLDVEDKNITLGDVTIPIRIYTPVEADTYGILLYFHGGAFFSGTLDSHDDIAREICNESSYKVISVGYRLAPEHPYPAGLHDCYDTVKWATEHAEELKWDGENLALAGDSSGATFVAAVTLMAREHQEFKISKQVLFYPSVDLDFSELNYPSQTENAVGYFVESDQLAEMNSFYLSNGADVKDPFVSPIRASSFKDLPEAFILTAEYDPMRDEGQLYAEKLQADHVAVEHHYYKGVTHGFLGKFTFLDEYKNIYKEVATFLNK